MKAWFASINWKLVATAAAGAAIAESGLSAEVVAAVKALVAWLLG